MGGFVTAGDWHLSRLTWQHRPRIVGDSFFALEQIVSFCIERRAALLGLGDLCDKDRPDSAAVTCLSQQMQRMQDAGLPVFYIQGQHEMASPPWMSVHAWPIHVDRMCFTIPGLQEVTFYGLDWRPREQFEAAMAEMLTCPITPQFLLTHQVWNEHMGNVVTVPEANMQQVPPYVWAVLTGDYHKHQITTHATPNGSKQLVSTGAISVRNLGELDQKYFYYCPCETNLEFLSVPIRGRPWVSTQITSLDQLTPLKEQLQAQAVGLPDYMQAPICDLKVSADIPGAYQAISEAFQDSHLWLEVTRSEIQAQEVVLTEAAAQAQSLPDLISANVPEGDTREDLLELIGSHLSPTEAVRSLVARITQVEGANAS